MCVWRGANGMWPDAGPEVPHQRPAAGAQDAADLGQPGRRVGPVVHRQGADDQVERSVGERHRGHVTYHERRPGLVSIGWAGGVGSCPLDLAGSRVETGHLEAVLASQPDRQTAGSATHLEHPGPVRGNRRYVRGDAADQRAQHDPAQRVVDDGVADEAPSRHPVAVAARRPCRRMATVAAAAPSRSKSLRGRVMAAPLHPRPGSRISRRVHRDPGHSGQVYDPALTGELQYLLKQAAWQQAQRCWRGELLNGGRLARGRRP